MLSASSQSKHCHLEGKAEKNLHLEGPSVLNLFVSCSYSFIWFFASQWKPQSISLSQPNLPYKFGFFRGGTMSKRKVMCHIPSFLNKRWNTDGRDSSLGKYLLHVSSERRLGNKKTPSRLHFTFLGIWQPFNMVVKTSLLKVLWTVKKWPQANLPTVNLKITFTPVEPSLLCNRRQESHLQPFLHFLDVCIPHMLLAAPWQSQDQGGKKRWGVYSLLWYVQLITLGGSRSGLHCGAGIIHRKIWLFIYHTDM